MSKEELGLVQENDRLGRENRILKEESEVSKKATVFFASQKPCGLSLSKNTDLHFPLN